MIQFYKPTKSSTGTAASFSFNKDAIWLQLIKQSSWNDQTRTGSFAASRNDPNKTISIKLNPTEISAWIKAIGDNSPINVQFGKDGLFHTTDKGTTIINFGPYIGQDQVQRGYSLSVSSKTKDGQNQKSFLIGFTFAEGELIANYMKFALNKFFTIKYNEYAKSKPVAPKQEVEQEAQQPPVDDSLAFLDGDTFTIPE